MDFVGTHRNHCPTQPKTKVPLKEETILKKVLLTFLLMLTTLGASALAEKISIKGHTQDKVMGKCDGVSWPKTGKDTTYGCLNDDGSGIVCGGVTADDKKTCDTWRKLPPRLVDHIKAVTTGENKAGPQ